MTIKTMSMSYNNRMRIIQHRRARNNSRTRAYKHSSRLFVPISVFMAVALISGIKFRPNSTTAVLAAQQERLFAGTGSENKTSTAEFLPSSLGNGVDYPNTKPFATPPFITDNVSADERIRMIAEGRGLKLTSVPLSPIFSTNNSKLLQPPAHDAWQKLKFAAKAEGIPLDIVSGYRSVDEQRAIFQQQLNTLGVTDDQIIQGRADAQIIKSLEQLLPPGYSKHHSGFAVSFVCANGVQSFETSKCFKWLSDNNYLNAKQSGWLPAVTKADTRQLAESNFSEYIWSGPVQVNKEYR